jgi:hypothetical protein
VQFVLECTSFHMFFAFLRKRIYHTIHVDNYASVTVSIVLISVIVDRRRYKNIGPSVCFQMRFIHELLVTCLVIKKWNWLELQSNCNFIIITKHTWTYVLHVDLSLGCVHGVQVGCVAHRCTVQSPKISVIINSESPWKFKFRCFKLSCVLINLFIGNWFFWEQRSFKWRFLTLFLCYRLFNACNIWPTKKEMPLFLLTLNKTYL